MPTRFALIALALSTLTAACQSGDVPDDEPDVWRPADGDDCAQDDPRSKMWFTDADGDGFGSGDAVRACVAPEDTTLVDGDCNDEDPEIHPDRVDLCGDDIDSDCADTPTATVWEVESRSGRLGSPQSVNDLIDGEPRTFSYTGAGTSALLLCDVSAPIAFEVSGGGELWVRGIGDVELNPGRLGLANVSRGWLELTDIHVDQASADNGGALTCTGTQVRLNNVVLSGFRGTGDGSAIHVEDGCVLDANELTIDGWAGQDGPAITMSGRSTEVNLTESRIVNGTAQGTVGVHIGRDSRLTLERTLLTDNTGRAVVFSDNASHFRCAGSPGIETGILRNDASALEYATWWEPAEPYGTHDWTQCDFGEGADMNTIDVRYEGGGTWDGRFGNDHTYSLAR